MKKNKNALVILAGGSSKRFKKKLPKQFNEINGTNLIDFFLDRIDTNNFDIIVIVIKKSYYKFFKKIKTINPSEKLIYVEGGKNRQLSSLNALKKLKKYKPNNVLIHDAARPFCSNRLISKILKKLNKNASAIPYVLSPDRKVVLKKEFNKNLKLIQTPQGFNFKIILNAHLNTKLINAKDDSALLSEENLRFIKGEKLNIKITYSEDINYFKVFIKPIYKSGIGYDIHQIDKKIKSGLKLCGVKINFNKLIGHSDADVGIHAICDSIFGALSMKDIGYYFSNKDKKYKNKNSEYFLKFAKNKLKERKLFISNLDINFICEQPNIKKYRNKMILKISAILEIPKNIISIKATTNEKIGFIGDGLGIAAESIVQITNEKLY
ncbi:2-C-methyl-D-erythritol 2,4-cyclodiphosphate synthase [Pelagibacterales bacterium SAG-MED31]|nr:2-C-methyl-D-erythritol 2,4-cyclodiphosphate synthase [Pelagibacterales bacterium SAG-MED31]